MEKSKYSLIFIITLSILMLSCSSSVHSQTGSNNDTETEYSDDTGEFVNTPAATIAETAANFIDERSDLGSSRNIIREITIVSLLSLGLVIILYPLAKEGKQYLSQLKTKRDYINNQLGLAGFTKKVGILGGTIELIPKVTMSIKKDMLIFDLPFIEDPRFYAFIVKESRVTTYCRPDKLLPKLMVIKLYLDQNTKN